MRAPIASIAVALISVSLLACGDDEDQRPSKAEFIQRAGAICEQNKERADQAVERELPNLGLVPPTAAQGQRLLTIALNSIRATGASIARLEAPEGEQDRIAAYLHSYRRATAEMEVIAADPKRAGALMSGRIEDPFKRADALAGEYGIERCSGDDA